MLNRWLGHPTCTYPLDFGRVLAAVRHVKDRRAGFYRYCVTFYSSQNDKNIRKKIYLLCEKALHCPSTRWQQEKDSGIFLCPLSIKTFCLRREREAMSFSKSLLSPGMHQFQSDWCTDTSLFDQQALFVPMWNSFGSSSYWSLQYWWSLAPPILVE